MLHAVKMPCIWKIWYIDLFRWQWQKLYVLGFHVCFCVHIIYVLIIIFVFTKLVNWDIFIFFVVIINTQRFDLLEILVTVSVSLITKLNVDFRWNWVHLLTSEYCIVAKMGGKIGCREGCRPNIWYFSFYFGQWKIKLVSEKSVKSQRILIFLSCGNPGL